MLLERTLKRLGIKEKSPSVNKVLLEVPVEMGSMADGSAIKDILWPRDCLLVAIKRGNGEIIPKGTVEIMNGDYLVALADSVFSSNVLEQLKSITLVE